MQKGLGENRAFCGNRGDLQISENPNPGMKPTIEVVHVVHEHGRFSKRCG